ncbi:MAG: hypothetical protein EBY80_07770 [Actinobacteria bacterium]|nr:hypothetical protein [Actinomycetota bacterium]
MPSSADARPYCSDRVLLGLVPVGRLMSSFVTSDGCRINFEIIGSGPSLLCTSPGGGGGSSYPLETLVDLPAEERGRLMMTIVDSRFDDEWFESHPQDRVFVAPRAELTGSAAIGYRRQLEARRHHDVWDRLALVDSPTLVASGTHDGIAAPANGRAIASRIPRSEFREYVGGHMFMFQDSRALPDMMDFLSTKEYS